MLSLGIQFVAQDDAMAQCNVKRKCDKDFRTYSATTYSYQNARFETTLTVTHNEF